jgi:anti-anti-sigma regulatory factor
LTKSARRQGLIRTLVAYNPWFIIGIVIAQIFSFDGPIFTKQGLEANVELSPIGLNGQLTTLACAGEITRQDLLGPDDPLLLMLGEGCVDGTVLLDLQRARSIDTMGVHWLARVHRRFEEAGGKFILYSVPPRIHDMLHFLRLDQVLHVARNLTEGLALARGGLP